MTRTPAPSPITKPLRSLSNGIEERSGSSVVERAVRALKPPIPILDVYKRQMQIGGGMVVAVGYAMVINMMAVSYTHLVLMANLAPP